MNLLSPYLSYIKYGAIAVILITAFGYVYNLKSTITELGQTITAKDLTIMTNMVNSQVRESQLLEVTRKQQETISGFNTVYTTVNTTLGQLIEQSEKANAIHDKAFTEQQQLLKTALIPQDCIGAIGYMVDYTIQHPWSIK